MIIRLNKFLSGCSVASRRKADLLIEKGLIKINGSPVYDLGTKIDTEKDSVEFEGNLISIAKFSYYILNKPKGYVVSSDGQDSQTIYDLFPHNIPYVGRLDKDSTGLLILTNDGDLSNLLTHPKHKVSKNYRVTISREPTMSELLLLRSGVDLEDGKTKPCLVKVISKNSSCCIVDIILKEGKKRQIRRMFDAIDIKVVSLNRYKFGPIELINLKSGEFRELSNAEIKQLKDSVNPNT